MKLLILATIFVITIGIGCATAATPDASDSQQNSGIDPKNSPETTRPPAVKEDYMESYYQLSLAATSGDKNFIAARDRMALHLTQAQIAYVKKRVGEWKVTTTLLDSPGTISVNGIQNIIIKAESGEPKAQGILGSLYAKGNNLPQNYNEAAKWYQKSADQGWAPAQNDLGLLYKEGAGVPQNYAEAMKWFLKAAEQGQSVSQISIGEMYLFGKGTKEDDVEAAKWYRKAADQGVASAQGDMGMLYLLGKGVTRDNLEAYKWYSLAGSGDPAAAKHRDAIAATLTPEQLVEAKRRVADWKPTTTAAP